MIEIEDEIENTGGVSPRFILGSFIVVAVGLAVVLGLLLSDGDNDSATSASPVAAEEVVEETVEKAEEESVSTPKPVQSDSEEFWETGPVEILGDPIPVNADIGVPAPAFKAQPNNSGQPIMIDPADGTVRLIGFFAHWCPHCQREVPRVSQWLAENGVPEEIEIIAISTAVREGAPNYPPSEWLIDENWPTQILVDSEESELATAYGLDGFPYWILVDATGTVMHQSSGELTEEQFGYLVDFAVSIAPQIT
jgi:thiol-disulfide isomerase/thioredoxin